MFADGTFQYSQEFQEDQWILGHLFDPKINEKSSAQTFSKVQSTWEYR